MPTGKVRVFIALGSNLEPREEHLRQAIRGLDSVAEVVQISTVYESAPIGFSDQPAFLNAVVEVQTDKAPLDLLGELKSLERAIGRKERPRWHEREIDFDIIFYGTSIFEDPQLTIPHPEAHRRLFVLKPLADLDAKFVHPVLQRSVAELLEALAPDAADIQTTDIQLR